MLFSSAMEEASGKHYEVRFSTTQRWAVASVVLLVLWPLYVALEIAAFVLSALALEPSGIMWGGELVSGEALRALRLFVVVTLCCGLEVCQVMVRSRLLWERGEKDEALGVARRHRNVGLALVALGAALIAADLELGHVGALVLPAVLGIVCGVVIALAATLARRARHNRGKGDDKGDRVNCHEPFLTVDPVTFVRSWPLEMGGFFSV